MPSLDSSILWCILLGIGDMLFDPCTLGAVPAGAVEQLRALQGWWSAFCPLLGYCTTSLVHSEEWCIISAVWAQVQLSKKEYEEDGAAVIAVLTFGEADEQLQLTRLELKQLSLEHLAMLWKVHSRNRFISIVLESPLQCL